MNLLFVIDDLGPGGAQRQMVNLARGIKSRGHHVELFTYYSDNHYRPLLDEACILVHSHSKQKRFSVSPLIALHKFISKGSYDIALSFLNTPNFYTELANIGLKKTKLVVSERFMYLPGNLPFRQRLLQECHRLSDAITVNSHHQRLRMEREFPWMIKKLQTIYNGFDLDVFHPDQPVQRGDDGLALLAISSVSFKKNSLNLAKALSICRNKYKLYVHIDWIGTHLISGEGTLPMQQTSDYLKDTGLTDQWNWLRDCNDIPQMLACHDALIHPSYFEGLPNVICEALACGRPVLASNVCDHPLLVQDKITGYLFDPNSPESIADSIHTFSRLRMEARIEMGKAARSFAEKHLSLERYVDEYESLFCSLSVKPDGRM